MKIGIFTDTYFPQVNGVTFTISLWKQKLEEKGHEVYVYYPSGKYKPGLNEHSFKSFEFKFYKDFRVAFPLGMVKEAKSLDVVHIHGLFSMAIAGLRVSQKYDLPRLLTYHTPADEYINYITQTPALRGTLMRIYNLWEKRLLNSCDIVTCPSKFIRDRLVAKGVKDVIVLSNGVDLDFFKPVNPANFKQRHGIYDEGVIGFCGRFGYEKHLEDLIGISDDYKGQILLAGKGPAEEYYIKLAEGKNNVKFLGFLKREDLLALYSSMDMFVFPSTAETQGLVALESMACGTPVVGANAMALKDTIQNGVNGYLYESGDKVDLLNKLELALENREKLSANAKEYVKEHSVEKTAERLCSIYAGLLEKHG